ncbi:MAG TPA: hypothetical protein VIY48_00430 [Candidatus Paceibacterota bacterium]
MGIVERFIRFARETSAFMEGSSQHNSAGMANGNRKLSESDVIEIRALVAQGVKRSEIAAKFGIVASYVNDISAKKTWRTL